MSKPAEGFHPRMKREVDPKELGQPYPYSRELMRAIIDTGHGHVESATNYSDAVFLLRKCMGCSIEGLAARIGSTYGVIYRAESGRSVPRPQVLRDLARLASTRGLGNYERCLNIEADKEQERIMERTRNASPRAD